MKALGRGAALSRLIIQLPEDRDFCGTLSLLDARGTVMLGPWPVCGRSTDELAIRFNNARRERVLRYGDTPLGAYVVAGVIPTGSGTAFSAAEFGRAGAIALEPKDGEAAIAEANGRFSLLIVGGPPSRDGRLRSTAGALRTAGADLRLLIGALRQGGEFSCEVQQASKKARAGKVFVDRDFLAEDPPPPLGTLGLTVLRVRHSRTARAGARAGRAASAIILGISVSFIAMDPAAADGGGSPSSGISDAGPAVTPASSTGSSGPASTGAPGYVSNDPAVLRDRYIELKAQKAVFDKLTPADTSALEQRVQAYDKAISDIASNLPTLESTKSELATNTALARIGSAIGVLKGLGDMGSVITQLYPESKPVGKAWDIGTGAGEAINKARENDYVGALTTAAKELGPSLVPENAEAGVEAATSGAAAGHDAATAENTSKKVDVIYDAVASLAKMAGFDDVEAAAKAAKAAKAVGESVNNLQEEGETKASIDAQIDANVSSAEGMIQRLESKDNEIKSVLNAPKSSDNAIDDEMRTIEMKVPGIEEDTSAAVDDRASAIYENMQRESAIAVPQVPY